MGRKVLPIFNNTSAYYRASHITFPKNLVIVIRARAKGRAMSIIRRRESATDWKSIFIKRFLATGRDGDDDKEECIRPITDGGRDAGYNPLYSDARERVARWTALKRHAITLKRRTGIMRCGNIDELPMLG